MDRKISGFYRNIDRKVIKENHWVVQESGQEIFTGKSVGCKGKMTGNFERKVSGLYRNLK